MKNNLKPPLLRPPNYSIKEWLYGFPRDNHNGAGANFKDILAGRLPLNSHCPDDNGPGTGPGPFDGLKTVTGQTFQLIADVRVGRWISPANYTNFVEGVIAAGRYFCDVSTQISELIVLASRPQSTSTTFYSGISFGDFSDETTEYRMWRFNVTGPTAHQVANLILINLHTLLLSRTLLNKNLKDTVPDDWETYVNHWPLLGYELTENDLLERKNFIVSRSAVQRELQRAEWDENAANRLLEQMRIEEAQLKCFLRSKPWKEVEQLLSVVCVETEAEIKQDNVDSTSTAAHVETIEARHSPGFASVYWFGKTYEFTTTQAACVQVLWKAWENKTPTLSGETICDEAGASHDRIRVIFRNHPAWKTMIVSPKKGLYCLNVPDTPPA